MSFFDLYDEVYEEEYERSYQFIRKGLSGDVKKDITTLKATEKTLLDYQGLDWIGRSDTFLARNNASIAATEIVIQELVEEAKGH